MEKIFLFIMGLCVVSPIVKADEEVDPIVIVHEGRYIYTSPYYDLCDLRFDQACYVVVVESSSDIVVSGNITTYHNATIEKNKDTGAETSSHDEIIVESGSFSTSGGGTSDVRVSFVN